MALATSVTRLADRIVVDAGFRVPADSSEHAAELARDPARTLATLLTRFGLSYYSEKRRVYVTPLHVASLSAPLEELGPDQFARAVGLETPARRDGRRGQRRGVALPRRHDAPGVAVRARPHPVRRGGAAPPPLTVGRALSRPPAHGGR